MKKILFLVLASALFTSCAIKHPYLRYSSAIDFSKITRTGFFITESNSVSFPYDPVGSISAAVESGYEILGERNLSRDDIYGSSKKFKYGAYKNAEVEDAISELIESARKMGADAIINLQIVYNAPISNKYGVILSPSSYVVSGMAVKRR